MKIEITKIDSQLLGALRVHGLAASNACFQNCFGTVVTFGEAVPGGMSYVLCWLVDKFCQRHPHAVVGMNGKFFDITLQEQSKAPTYVCEYVLERSLSRVEAIEMFNAAGGRIEKLGDAIEIEGVPPALMADGSIRCELVPSL